MPDADPDDEAQSRAGREARDWIVRLSSGHVDAADLDLFRKWQDQSPAHARAFARERVFWQELKGLERQPVPDHAVRPDTRVSRRAVLAGGMAATCAGVVAAPRVMRWWSADFSTGVGETADMTLPDGTVASLNTDSAIALRFGGNVRKVALLRGEAEFRVPPAAGSEFQVSALDGISRAQDALFSVALDDGLVRVAVARGQASVSSGGSGRSVDLLSAQATSYGPGHGPAPAAAIDADVVFAWRQGRIILEGRRFDDAIRELGRYIPERIVMGPGVNPGIPVSAVFSTTAARQAVDALAKTQGLSVRRIPHVMMLIA